MYYSPAFLCLFTPTEIRENGVRQIVLEGASTASFRSPMGKFFFFFSKMTPYGIERERYSTNCRTSFSSFLGPAIFADYLQYN